VQSLLTVRDDQVQKLERAMADRFMRQATEALRRVWGDAAVLPPEATGRAGHTIEAAITASRLTEAASIVRFLSLRHAIGDDFPFAPTHGWARAILADLVLSEPTRLDCLIDETRHRWPNEPKPVT
jgi:hypothetical protein